MPSNDVIVGSWEECTGDGLLSIFHLRQDFEKQTLKLILFYLLRMRKDIEVEDNGVVLVVEECGKNQVLRAYDKIKI
jgi:hypothetical protein